jgi:chemotaxis protein CheD
MISEYPPSRPKPAITHVRIGEIRVASSGILKATLGSCVGIAFINRATGLCGLAHCFLPSSSPSQTSANARYANLAAENLLRKVAPEPDHRKDLRAFITGGGRLLAQQADSRLQVGEMNVQSVRESLHQLRIRFKELEVGTADACNGILNCDELTFVSEKIDPSAIGDMASEEKESPWN